METIIRLCLPLSRHWTWPKLNIVGLARSFREASELYGKALSMAYLTALVIPISERDKYSPGNEPDGRDPRW